MNIKNIKLGIYKDKIKSKRENVVLLAIGRSEGKKEYMAVYKKDGPLKDSPLKEGEIGILSFPIIPLNMFLKKYELITELSDEQILEML